MNSSILIAVTKDRNTFRYGRIEEMDDASDIDYWQQQSDEKKFEEAWRLVELSFEMRGLSKDELRFQRSIASLQRREG